MADLPFRGKVAYDPALTAAVLHQLIVVLFLDGVYSFSVGRKALFHPTPAPRDDDIARVAAAIFRRRCSIACSSTRPVLTA